MQFDCKMFIFSNMYIELIAFIKIFQSYNGGLKGIEQRTLNYQTRRNYQNCENTKVSRL